MLAELGREANVIASLNEIRVRFNGRLDELTDAEWRQLFIILNLEITIKGIPEVTLIQQDRQKKLSDFDLWDYVLLTEKVEVTISFPLKPETLENIVFKEPGGCAPVRYAQGKPSSFRGRTHSTFQILKSKFDCDVSIWRRVGGEVDLSNK
jgi:hypothetical protein